MMTITDVQYEYALKKEQKSRFERKKRNSKYTGYVWDVNFEDIEFPQFCPILGIEIDYFASFRQENSASFDRIDNTKGYIPGNVVVVSWRANRIKNDGTVAEHLAIVQYLESLAQPSNVNLDKAP